MQTTDQADTIIKFNDLLRGELSAIESYSRAIEGIHEKNMISILEEAHNCHVLRANTLNGRVRELSAEPATSSGAWGALARFVEGGAQMFGDWATIAVLEEGEDHGLELYTSLSDDDNLEVKTLARVFLPKQESTHRIMRDLKISISETNAKAASHRSKWRAS